MSSEFALFLFTGDPARAAIATAAGIDGVIVDWESSGKEARQAGADTEINSGTAGDLSAVRAATGARLICRINPWGSHTEAEVETAISCGADEVLLPMVREPAEVEATLTAVGGRCGTGILVETDDGVERAEELAALPITRAYLGLNDLAIDRGTPSIFTAVYDGTVERVSEAFDVPFGFAGLTLPARGHPIPCRLLIAEMARLACSFAFLRRSFRRDVEPTASAQAAAVRDIRTALATAAGRDARAVERERRELVAVARTVAGRAQAATRLSA